MARFSVRLGYCFPNPALQIADSDVPFIVTIPHLAPANKPNPGSRETYWGPSTPAKIFGIWTNYYGKGKMKIVN